MNLLRRLFSGRDPRSALNQTRTVRVHGVKFVIKKLDPVAHLTGSKVLLKTFDEYANKRAMKAPTPASEAESMKVVRDHYRDVFMQAVVWPKLCRKTEDAVIDVAYDVAVIPVDHLLTEWALAVELYTHIIEFTYGKKKVLGTSPTLTARSS